MLMISYDTDLHLSSERRSFAISVTRVAAVDLRWNPWWVHDVVQINLTVSSLPTHVTLLVHRVYMISSASKMKATMTWYHIKSLLKSAATNKRYQFFKLYFLLSERSEDGWQWSNTIWNNDYFRWWTWNNLPRKSKY